MTKINVKTKSESYDIIVENGILGRVNEVLTPYLRQNDTVLVTDDNVERLYLDAFLKGLNLEGQVPRVFIIPHGEMHKCADEYMRLLSGFAGAGLTRDGVVIALGGGVVGDIAGFAAATYARGVKLVQIPTTLLAGIDSSVGGKTAIDIPEGKNLVGAFHQPSVVIFDTATLETLPDCEMKNGFGELVKYGVLMGGRLWEILKGGRESFLAHLEEAVSLCVSYKRDIVEADERECGQRKLLNLGHTVAHSVEKLSSYNIPHGAAVGLGIRVITGACVKKGILQEAQAREIIGVLDSFGLNDECNYSARQLAEAARTDKKVAGEDISIITVHAIGDCKTLNLQMSQLEEWLNGH